MSPTKQINKEKMPTSQSASTTSPRSFSRLPRSNRSGIISKSKSPTTSKAGLLMVVEILKLEPTNQLCLAHLTSFKTLILYTICQWKASLTSSAKVPNHLNQLITLLSPPMKTVLQLKNKEKWKKDKVLTNVELFESIVTSLFKIISFKKKKLCEYCKIRKKCNSPTAFIAFMPIWFLQTDHVSAIEQETCITSKLENSTSIKQLWVNLDEKYFQHPPCWKPCYLHVKSGSID